MSWRCRTREFGITDVKFSPDGRFLATTSLDGSLDVYDSQSDFELRYDDVTYHMMM